jgi:hypothetical protein
MTTRFYLPSTGTAPLPALAVNTNWELNNGLGRLPCYTTKQDKALFTNTRTWAATATQQWVWWQFQSLPLTAAYNWTTADTVSMVIGKCGEQAAQTDTHLAYVVRIVSGDGATIRGVIGLYHATSTEYDLIASASTRIHNARTSGATNFSSQVGDRIIIEIGLHGVTPTLSSVQMRIGDPTGTADFALTEGLTTDLVPWVQLSRTVSFEPNAVATDGLTIGESKSVIVSALTRSSSDGLTVGESKTVSLIAPTPLAINRSDGLTIGESKTISNPLPADINISGVTSNIAIGESKTISNPLPDPCIISVTDGLTLGESTNTVALDLKIDKVDGLTIGEVNTEVTSNPQIVPVWWFSGGVEASDIQIVYQPMGMGNIALSHININNPGVNDAIEIVAPTWNPSVGWIFDGTQYLSTGDFDTSEETTIIIRFSGFVGSQDEDFGLLGKWISDKDLALIFNNTSNVWENRAYLDNQSCHFDGIVNSGVITITKNGIYLNGALQISFTTPTDFTDTTALFIGAINFNGSPAFYFKGNIQAVAIYKATLSLPQIYVISRQLMEELPPLVQEYIQIGSNAIALIVTDPLAVAVSDITVGEIIDLDITTPSAGPQADVTDGVILTDGPRYFTEGIIVYELINVEVSALEIAITDDITIGESKTVSNPLPADFNISVSSDLTIGESKTLTLVAPTPLDIVVTDGLIIGESKTISNPLPVDLGVLVSDDLVIGETDVITVSDLKFIVTDGLVVGDIAEAVLTSVLVYYVIKTDDLIIGESLTISNPLPADFDILFSDDVTLGESSTVSVSDIVFAITNDITLSDVATITILDLNAVATEDITVGESLIISNPLPGQTAIVVLDAITIGETNNQVTSDLIIDISNGITVGETQTISNPLPADQIISISNDVAIGESIVIENTEDYLVVSDGLVIGESLTIGTVSATDELINVSDGLVLGETPAITVSDLFVTEIDNITITDATITVSSNPTIDESDDLTIGDASTVFITASTDLLINITNGLSLGELVAVIVSDLDLVITDGITVGETLAIFTSNLSIDKTDGLIVGETQTVEIANLIAIASDNITITDTLGLTVSDLFITSIDGLVVGEVSVVSVYIFAYWINVTDNITMVDWGNIGWVVPGGTALFDESIWDVLVSDESIDDTIATDILIESDVLIGDTDNG